MKTPTLLDVARAAGVSKATVSNVFGAPERVRPQLRAAVEAAARELGYGGPDPRGRLLSVGVGNQIGVVGPAEGSFGYFFSDPYMLEFMQGVVGVCAEHGVSLSILSPDQLPLAVADGFILGSPAQAALVSPSLRRRVPFVVAQARGPDDMSSVVIDDYGGARRLTEYLLALGHRRFALASISRVVVPPLVYSPGRDRRFVSAYPSDLQRFAGIADALATYGLSLDDMPIMEACGSDEERSTYGFDWADLLFDNLHGATAIIGLCATLTLGALAAARRRGLAVPADLSIVGFDDPPGGDRSDPPLTVIRQPTHDVGATCARILMARAGVQHVALPVEFIARASAAAPKS